MANKNKQTLAVNPTDRYVEVQVANTLTAIGTEVANLGLATKGTIETDEFTSGAILQKKTYSLENAIGNRTTLTTTNPLVIKSTEMIYRAMAASDITEYVVCRELYNLDEEAILSEMGFKSIVEYGKAMFGLKPVTVRQYVRIGQLFIDENYKIKSDIIKVKNKSQLVEMLAYVDGTDISALENAYKEGVVTGTETQKVFRQNLKEYFTQDEDILEKDEVTPDAEPGLLPDETNDAEPALLSDEEPESKKGNSTKTKNDTDFGHVARFVAHKNILMDSFDMVKSVISEMNLDFTVEEIQDVERAFMIIQQFANKLVELV